MSVIRSRQLRSVPCIGVRRPHAGPHWTDLLAFATGRVGRSAASRTIPQVTEDSIHLGYGAVGNSLFFLSPAVASVLATATTWRCSAPTPMNSLAEDRS